MEEAAERLRITMVRQEREGYGAGRARNLGAAAARADVLLFVDADCLPDPELVAGHMAWHHRADNLVVVGSRQHVDSTGVSAEAIADGSIDVRRLVKGDDPPDEAFAPEDWRRTFYRRTADLRHGNEAFRSLLTGNCSLRRDRFLEAGGFSTDFRHWGGEDTELGWRLFSAGMFFVPANRAAIYHQQQEESHPEEGWRRGGPRRQRRPHPGQDPASLLPAPHRPGAVRRAQGLLGGDDPGRPAGRRVVRPDAGAVVGRLGSLLPARPGLSRRRTPGSAASPTRPERRATGCCGRWPPPGVSTWHSSRGPPASTRCSSSGWCASSTPHRGPRSPPWAMPASTRCRPTPPGEPEPLPAFALATAPGVGQGPPRRRGLPPRPGGG